MMNTWTLPAETGPAPDTATPSSASHFTDPGSSGEPSLAPARTPAQQQAVSTRRYACRQNLAGGVDVDHVSADQACAAGTEDTPQRFSLRLGRRLGSGSGILGKFDGVRMDYHPNENLGLHGIAGYRPLSASDVFNPARQVYGISAESALAGRDWDLGSYLVEQQENGHLAGRALGGALRYLQPGRSMLVFLDYDVADHTLGTLLTTGAWMLPGKTTVSATLDLQHRPIRERQQQYLQDSMTVTEGWNWLLPTDRLAYYTGAGTNRVSILAGSLSHALSRRIRLSGDVVLLDATGDTDTAATNRSSEVFYHLKLTGQDLLIAGDRSKLDVRRTVTEDGETRTATLDTRFTIRRFWNLVSQLRADYFSPSVASDSHWVASPNVKMEYRPNRHYGFHIEAGGSLSNGEDPAADSRQPSYFVSLGYQAKF